MAGTRDVGWDDEDTRRAVARYRQAGIGWFLAGAALLVVAVVVASWMGARSEGLERSGVEVPGRVVDTGGGLRLSGSVTVAFEWGGMEQRRTIGLNSNSPRYELGDPVTVLVDPDDPSRVRTTEEPNDPTWSVWLFVATIIAGATGLSVGIVTLRRSRRWRKLLQHHEWRLVNYDYREVPVARTVQPLVAIDEPSGRVVRGTASCPRWRLRPLRAGTSLYIAGAPEGPFVAAPERGGPLFELWRARSDRRQRRWEASFDVVAE